MALCSGVAAVALTLGVLSSVPAITRRLAAVRIPIPIRSLTVLLTIASLATVLARPRTATATVPPPIVRLADEAPPATEDPQGPAHEIERTQSASAAYVVEPGDNLWRIAAFVLPSGSGQSPSNAEIARFWPAIYAANRALIGDNPNLIFPGQQLLIPEG